MPTPGDITLNRRDLMVVAGACAALPAIDAPAPAAESMPKAPLHKTVATLSLTQDPEVMTPPPKAI